ncbi:hypothetical protein K440DRAFT_74781 [Wilcoxina mikolae CBS 423.85]|nr:hypothetical protein K440DRAFT_74781 [Wilcoxina mikolae CBS 423.85]
MICVFLFGLAGWACGWGLLACVYFFFTVERVGLSIWWYAVFEIAIGVTGRIHFVSIVFGA